MHKMCCGYSVCVLFHGSYSWDVGGGLFRFSPYLLPTSQIVHFVVRYPQCDVTSGSWENICSILMLNSERGRECEDIFRQLRLKWSWGWSRCNWHEFNSFCPPFEYDSGRAKAPSPFEKETYRRPLLLGSIAKQQRSICLRHGTNKSSVRTQLSVPNGYCRSIAFDEPYIFLTRCFIEFLTYWSPAHDIHINCYRCGKWCSRGIWILDCTGLDDVVRFCSWLLRGHLCGGSQHRHFQLTLLWAIFTKKEFVHPDTVEILSDLVTFAQLLSCVLCLIWSVFSSKVRSWTTPGQVFLCCVCVECWVRQLMQVTGGGMSYPCSVSSGKTVNWSKRMFCCSKQRAPGASVRSIALVENLIETQLILFCAIKKKPVYRRFQTRPDYQWVEGKSTSGWRLLQKDVMQFFSTTRWPVISAVQHTTKPADPLHRHLNPQLCKLDVCHYGSSLPPQDINTVSRKCLLVKKQAWRESCL